VKDFAIQQYLARWKVKSSVSYALLGAAVLVAGVVLVFLTFWATYGILWFISPGLRALADLTLNKKVSIPHTARLIGSGVFVLLLFVQYFRTNPWYWQEYPKEDLEMAEKAEIVFGAAGAILSRPGTSAKMIADLLITGPRLVASGCRTATTAIRIVRLDPVGCARLLAYMLARDGTVPYEELRAAGWEPWLGQLRCLGGVRFFEKGLSLSDELKQELCV
jgi:hypothetical protein